MSRSVARPFYTRSEKFVVRATFTVHDGHRQQVRPKQLNAGHARVYGAANITKRPVPAGGEFTHKATAQQAGTHFYHSNDHVDRQHALGPGTKAVGTPLVPMDCGCRGQFATISGDVRAPARAFRKKRPGVAAGSEGMAVHTTTRTSVERLGKHSRGPPSAWTSIRHEVARDTVSRAPTLKISEAPPDSRRNRSKRMTQRYTR
ncbi:multicopper oxidase domain-containing protein [Caballeronia novacaledonica]|uniref:multicopper oxidase domain-containing protein n=1 Tax=Caballeronia novacaledonica TaxID=1544861 RepID=UPI0038571CB7